MRLIYTTPDIAKGHKLSDFLTGKKIANQFESAVDTDWGSHAYGNTTGKIWVYDEDQYEQAKQWVDAFERNADDPQFDQGARKSLHLPPVIENKENKSSLKIDVGVSALVGAKGGIQKAALRPDPLGRVTLAFLILCCMIFTICELTSPSYTSLPTNLPLLPLTSSPVEKQLLYDYPSAFNSLDKLVKLYGIDSLQAPQDLPTGGQYLLDEFHKESYWEGGYDLLLQKLQGGKVQQPLPPLFEKIRQGEVWRLFTPCLLHHDILHLIFNMIWLVVLGKQMGQRLTAPKYILFVLLVGVFSNTCQYLVSGANFLGFSGILCGMLAFIWVRQKKAPWEGYPLPRSTILFMLYFILTMLGIQLISFYLEVAHQVSISPGIANTAHFAGAFSGALLGYFSYFSWNAAKSLKGGK